MRIIITTIQVPFFFDEAEYVALNLKRSLLHAGHQVEIVAIPCNFHPPLKIPEQMLASRLLDLSDSCGIKTDLLIGLEFPAYYFRHPNKVVWLLHQHRPAYELWGTEYSDLHLDSSGLNVRESIIRADSLYLKEAKSIVAISKNVSDRLKKFNHLESNPLYHPCPNAEEFHCETFDEYILYPGRLDNMRRQHLAIEAMRYVKSNLKLYMVGQADEPQYCDKLKELVSKYDLEGKVIFINFVSEEEKLSLYANCRAVLFTPYDEDYGYVTIEAFYARKPVITCTDSGGPLEFVEHEENGFVSQPEAIKLADAINAFGKSKGLAMEMGEKAFKKISGMNISWDNVVKELTNI